MNYKILVATILLIGFTVSAQSQTLISSGDVLIKELEQKAERQRAAEKENPALSKTRSGRIATKEEKLEYEKIRKEKNQKLAKALKGEASKNGGKMKVSKGKKSPTPQGTEKQPTKGTIKKLKIKE